MLDQVARIEHVGEEPTYDLEAPELHNFVADDFIVHNSHATHYAMTTLQTAYLKARYPLEYMMAMLVVERDRADRVSQLVAESRRMGIQVLPPNVNASRVDFDIQIGTGAAAVSPTCNFDFPIEPGSAIRFGLAAIKNVSTRAVQEQIVDKRPPAGFALLETFCDECALQEVGRKTLEALIYSGALDDWGNRLQLLDVLGTMLIRSKSSNGGAREFQDSLFGDEEISVPIKLPQRTVSREDALRLAEQERELLGHVVGELVKVLRKDLDSPERSLWIRGKRGVERKVFFSSEAWEVTRQYLALREPLDLARTRSVSNLHLYCRHDTGAGTRMQGLTPQTVQGVIRKLAHAARLEDRGITPHALRHYFGTRIYQVTGDLAVTQTAMGHTSPVTTRIYAKLNDSAVKDAHEKAFPAGK